MADEDSTLQDDIDVTDEDLLLDDERIVSNDSNILIDQEVDALKEERTSEPDGFGTPNSSPDLVDEEDEYRRMIEEGAGASLEDTEDLASLGMQEEEFTEDDLDDATLEDDLDTLGDEDKF